MVVPLLLLLFFRFLFSSSESPSIAVGDICDRVGSGVGANDGGWSTVSTSLSSLSQLSLFPLCIEFNSIVVGAWVGFSVVVPAKTLLLLLLFLLWKPHFVPLQNDDDDDDEDDDDAFAASTTSTIPVLFE
jgi:hypothetical protein